MAITQVSPDNGDGILWFSNSNSAALEHNNLQAGDVVFITVNRRRTSGTATSTSPATITTGSSPQNINSSFRSINTALQSQPVVDWYVHPSRDNARYAAGVFQFVLTANDLTNGRLAVTFSFGSSLRQGLSIVAFRGVDTGTYFSTTTTGSNELLCTNLDSTTDDTIEFTAPGVTAVSNFWNASTGNLDVPHTVLAMGAFGRTDFDANSGTNNWSPAFNLAGTNSFIDSGNNHTLLGMYRSFTTFNATNMNSIAVTTSNQNQRSFSFWIVLREASTGPDPVSETDSGTVVDTVTQTKSAVFANQDTSNASDALSAVKSASFTATDTSETSDSLSAVKSAASSNTDTSEASDTLSAVKATTESNTDTSEASDSLSATIVKTSESTDASSAIDSATLNKSAESTSIEPATSIDSIVLKKTSAETITDTGSFVDVVTDLNASSEQKTDSASSVDSLTITQTHNVVETDFVSIEDASVEIQTNGVTVSDESQVVDSISVLKSFNVIITDISTSVDSIADVKSATQVNTDQSTSIDPIVLVKTHNVSQTDNVALEDNLTSTKQDQSIVNETDGATSQDALVISSTFNVVATDTNTSVDSIVLVLSHSEDIVDQSTTSDDPTIEKQTQNTVVNVTDSSTGVDSVVSKLDINESKIDPVTAEDLLSLGLNSVFIETDQSGAVDEVSLSRVIYFPSVTDPVSSSDTLDISVAKAQDIVDSGSGVDALTRKLDYELELSDSGEALDEIVAVLPEKVELQATITGVGGIDPNLMKEAQAVATIDVWNVALNALGISTLATTEGNNPQQTLLSNTFSLFRKQFLSDHLWNGAKRTTDLTKLDVNTTDQSVANRWKYVYVLPTDCMRVWRLNGQENKPVHVGGNSNIYTNRWEIEVVTKGTTGGDTNTGRYRALCTNEDEARIEYVFDVINDIDLLGPLTQHAMGLALAAFVATNFGKSASEIAQLEAQAKDAITAAKGVDGQEGTPQIFGDTSLLGVRSIGY